MILVRPIALVLIVSFSSIAGIGSASTDEPVVISGVGAAHGFGLAMDGVEGQARAGWSHDRILSLFYPGTSAGRAAGKIRVGLHEGPSAVLTLPYGGGFSELPRGSASPTLLAAGTKIALRASGGAIVVESGLRLVSRKPASLHHRQTASEPPLIPPTAPPPPEIEDTPKPKPSPTPPAKKTTGPRGTAFKSVWLWGTATPAIVGLHATGRRYRGTIEVRPKDDGLVVVNHVDLETYVAGIAEEKGQGWPIEGLKTLAIAARTLGAATMTWYDKNRASGYDICPTESCQVYLGYDGEEAAMSEATAATAGQIRTYNGRPILAMYHGNGGGQTESYAKVIDNGTDPYPYLRSVTYPFADPSRWKQKKTLAEIGAALTQAGIAVPGPIERIKVTERGESPRVVRLRIEGAEQTSELTGVRFAEALELPSTWFELGPRPGGQATVSTKLQAGSALADPLVAQPKGSRGWWPAALVAAFSAALLGVGLRLRSRDLPR